MLLVYVMLFNVLMWDNGVMLMCVIEYGVLMLEGVEYYGMLLKGVVVVNNFVCCGWCFGVDLFEVVWYSVLIDLVGMGLIDFGGIGEVLNLVLL